MELLELRIEPLHGRELVRAEAHNLVVRVRAEGKGDTVVVQARKTLDPRMAAMLILFTPSFSPSPLSAQRGFLFICCWNNHI